MCIEWLGNCKLLFWFAKEKEVDFLMACFMEESTESMAISFVTRKRIVKIQNYYDKSPWPNVIGGD